VNDLRKEVVIAEIKVSKARISLIGLEDKAKNLSTDFYGYKVEYRALGVEDAVEIY